MQSKQEIQVVDNVPIPTGPVIRKKARYPFEDLKKVGQSFFVAGVTTNAMQSAAHRFRTQHAPDCKYKVAQVEEVVPGREPEGPQPGVRVWRTT